MRSITQPPPPRWKTVFLPGLLLGILLALIELAFFMVASTLGILGLPDNFTFIWWILLFLYLAIPALFAFLVKNKTGQSAIGYRIGRFAGISSAVLLMVVTIAFLASTKPDTSHSLGLAGGALVEAAMYAFFFASLFLNIFGAILATPGSFLGSRSWKRGQAI